MDEDCCPSVMTDTAEDSKCSGGVGPCGDSEAAGTMMEPSLKDNGKMTRCSEDLSAVCDETASVAHKLIGQILKNMLHEEEVDELTNRYFGGGYTSQDSQVAATAKNQKANIVMNTVQAFLPTLPKSSMDKVRRILDGAEQ